jgi:prophage antirepressor-like protein
LQRVIIFVASYEWQDGKVRVVMIDGNPWFLAKDVCRALGIGNVSKACGAGWTRMKRVSFQI